MSAGAIKAQPLDLRTDMWALGVTLLEALCGYNLFQRATLNETYAAVLATTELDVDTLVPEISVDLKRIISRCLSKSPTLGFTSTQEIETEIANIGT
jgi:serine/threonine-protein kinase